MSVDVEDGLDAGVPEPRGDPTWWVPCSMRRATWRGPDLGEPALDLVEILAYLFDFFEGVALAEAFELDLFGGFSLVLLGDLGGLLAGEVLERSDQLWRAGPRAA
ncbi:MAG: hypothetical protein IH818_00005 [Acidobacteria bacterium]|nr:hypothetical protein [Acidobacteriota bacterium]